MIQNLKHLSYKLGRILYVTDEGIEWYFKNSNTHSLKDKKDEFLNVLDDAVAELVESIPRAGSRSQPMRQPPPPVQPQAQPEAECQSQQLLMENLNEIQHGFKLFAQDVVEKVPLMKEAMRVTREEKMKNMEVDRQAADLAAENMQRQNKLEEEATVIKERQIKLEEEATMINERHIEYRKRMLELDREEFEFSEMKHKRASPQAPENEQKAGSVTIREVAEEHQELFIGIDKKEYEDILMKAERICANTYKKAGKMALSKEKRGRCTVTLYNPEDKETFVLSALKSAVVAHKTQVLIAKNIMPNAGVFAKETV